MRAPPGVFLGAMPQTPESSHTLISDSIDTVGLFRRVQELFGGTFEILELVAASPVRALFVAKDRVLKRKVGLRVHVEPGTPGRRWFERETELLAALDHPVLRTVFAAGYVDDWAFRLVKWIDGESLADAVARGPRPIQGVLRLARSLVVALEYVHTQHIVVRRLAPSMVMIDATERPYIIDLRYANVLLDVVSPDPDRTKEPFVAPEVRGGGPGEPGSDVYSAAALLYYAVTGRPPSLVPSELVPPRKLRETCPAALERVILRGLRRQPQERYLTAVEMLNDLISDLGDYDIQLTLGSAQGSILEDPRAWEKRLRRALGDEYELLEELGAGGFGTVYRVRDLALEREVALKVLHPYLTVDPGVVERFRREAQMAAQVMHPNIANTYDIGGRAGLLWYTMEYVRGKNVSRLVQAEGPLPLPRVIRIMLDALSGLEYAHGRGLVHRDLKPENLLIDDATGTVHIVDFGLAIALRGGDRAHGVPSRSGTPDFAAPEQLLGEQVDRRADLYSLTLVALFALTGTLAFGGDPIESILARRAAGELPELELLRDDVPERVLRVFARGAARDPQERFQSAAEYTAALQSAIAPAGGLAGIVRRIIGPG
jgi:serine/threonine protein kinase